MPKQEVGSTKWLGNKMKAKGLQKLRWYCQMCQKQCRDENGFKCHRMSDSHQRQMQLFVQDPNRFMDDFSQEFELGFMQLMGHTYRSTRVLANTVYCDFISNRHHTHMNSTIWVTLSNFVQYLGRTTQCKIEKTPKGWYLCYIDNTPEAMKREQDKKDLERHELDAEVQHESYLAKQVKRAGEFHESEFTELQREEGDAPIAFAMSAASSSSAGALPSAVAASAAKAAKDAPAPSRNVLEDAFEAHGSDAKASSSSARDKKPAGEKMSAAERIRNEFEGREKQLSGEKKMSAAERIRNEFEGVKRQKVIDTRQPSSSSETEAEPWLAAGLVVKVMHQELANGKYHRKKGQVEKVHDQYAADVRMVDSKDLIRLEQEMLETVIPNVGKRVRVVKGSHKGHRATMRAVDMTGFCVTVELDNGTVMEGIGYSEVCKEVG